MMRFTIVDETITTSFTGPPHLLKAIAACCARGAATVRSLLVMLADYDGCQAAAIRDGLAIFREHNTPEEPGWIRTRLSADAQTAGPFEVLDDQTRAASLEPTNLGIVIFNLAAHRIVQIQNSYANLERSDRGRIRMDGRAASRFYHYELPDEWTIVP